MNEFNTAGIRNIKSAAITEYKMISDNVARVIATFVGSMDQDEAIDRVAAVLANKARPIKGSFRWLTKDRVAIGYVAVNQQVRAFKEDAPGLRKVTANLFMDASDETLWELRPGVGGRYLTRQGTDNLAELIEAKRVPPRGSIPKMNSILSASASKDKFVEFVDVKSASLDYGFCVEEKDGKYEILSHTTNEPITVEANAVVSVHTMELSKQITDAIKSSKKVNAALSKEDSIAYYKKAYGYAPEYLAMVIKQVNSMASM